MSKFVSFCNSKGVISSNSLSIFLAVALVESMCLGNVVVIYHLLGSFLCPVCSSLISVFCP